MALRDKLNQYPVIVIGAVVAVIILTVLIAVLSLRGEGGRVSGPRWIKDKDFFSDDEGRSYFVDDISNIPPFQHNGKTAIRAVLFIDSNDRKFIGYLESYDPDVKAKIDEQIKSGKPVAEVLSQYRPNVKKPGGAWIKAKNGKYPSEFYRLTATPPDPKAQVVGSRLHVTDEDLASH